MKNIKIPIALLFFHAAFCVYAQPSTSLPLDITVFKGKNAIENAFLIRSQKNLVLIDALGSGSAAEEILRETKGKKITTIFITHGHPDHFLGLSTILRSNPEAKVYVGRKGVKDDIVNYANFAASKGVLDNEPSMKPKSAENPEGFDYKKVDIISGNRLDIGDGNYLLIESINDPAECRHHTILYSPQLNLLFASDILYNKVFSWLGPGVDRASVENWINIINDLKHRFGKEGLVIFPGHGEKSDGTLFDVNLHYLNSFCAIIRRAKYIPDVLQFFKELYPDHQGELLLSRSIEHWIDSATSVSNHISINNIQDLTHTLTTNFPFIPVPGVTFPFEITPIAKMEDHGVRANKWIIHEHIGTQVDAPNHFARDGIAIDEVKVEDLIVPVIVIDISKKSLENPDAVLTVEDILDWETIHGPIPMKACVMMYSGWEEFLYEVKYLGLDKSQTKHFPGISASAIQFLIDERNISGVGVDVISFDPGIDHDYKGHKLLLGAGKWALEAVANLKKIPAKGAFLFVGAPKIQGSTGGIVRLLAVW